MRAGGATARVIARFAMAAFAASSAVASLAASTSGCAVGKELLAPSDDLADYRAFRVAAHRGARLARAEVYLSVHPNGAWADEVRATYASEEAAYFEDAKGSRKAALEYLEYLPRGPHADAAKAVVDTFEHTLEDARLAEVFRQVKIRAAERKEERARRAKVRALVLSDIGALLDPDDYGTPRALAPDVLRRALAGGRTPTIGWVPPRDAETLFFRVPTRQGYDDRSVTVELAVVEAQSLIIEGRVRGADLFVGWTEADESRALDPTSKGDRAEAASHVAALAGGALEARLPEATCGHAPPARVNKRGARFILFRSCDGWIATAVMGGQAGDVDEITIRRAMPVRAAP